MDSTLLKNIALNTRIGVPDAERSAPQRVLVTVELLHPLLKTGLTDDVRHAINYRDVTNRIVDLGTAERKTIEHLAQDIATMILKEFTPAGGVTVTITKTPDLPLESASVTITRP